MSVSSRLVAAALIALQLGSYVRADLYMHHPPGSNDRNRERNENRNNDNLRFDSQNNAKGGYPWAGDRELVGQWDGPKWYAESELRIEWTAQHGCGPNADVDCQLIIQYSCSDTVGTTVAAIKEVTADELTMWYAHLGGNFLRDGYPTGPLEEADANNPGQYKRASFRSEGQNADGTETIPCASSVGAGGCPAPNFNDDSMDKTPEKYNAFYMADASTGGITGTTGTWYPTEFSYHETFYWYRDFCLNRYRNKGLYHADQQLNGESARYTRQENNGQRYGFECNEERDYYPWWNPSPWIDIAIMVDDLSKCDYYTTNSQNVADRWYCKAKDPTVNTRMPLSPEAVGTATGCSAAGGTWIRWPAWGIAAPECLKHPYSRDNHLGNVNNLKDAKGSGNDAAISTNMPETAHYNWKIPTAAAGKSCVVRLRYNMSSSDYPQSNWQTTSTTAFTTSYAKDVAETKLFWDSRFDCDPNIDEIAKAGVTTGNNKLTDKCINVIDGDYVPAGINRPYVSITEDTEKVPLLSIAFNTDQIARTFQDRSYVFQVMENKVGRNVVNLSMRGRRGNIVQCYPAVELDYVPHDLSLTEDDALYIQFCGSDFNPQNNPNNGEGWQYSTRANMVALPNDKNDNYQWDAQPYGQRRNFPTLLKERSVFDDATTARALAFIGVDWKSMSCYDFQSKNNNNDNNNITNCGKLNPSKACQAWLLVNLKQGEWQFVNTRQNNFSNRAMKGSVKIGAGSLGKLSSQQIAGISAGVTIFVLSFAAAGAVIYAKKNPDSRMAGIFKFKKSTRATNI